VLACSHVRLHSCGHGCGRVYRARVRIIHRQMQMQMHMYAYRARDAPAVLVADHRPVLPRDGVIGAQVAQCVVRIVVVVPVLVAVVPAPAIVESPARGVPSGRRTALTCLCGAGDRGRARGRVRVRAT